MVRKVSRLPTRLLKGAKGDMGMPGMPGMHGRDGKDGITKVITEVVERLVEAPVVPENLMPTLDEIRKKVKKLEERKPETVGYGGGQALVKYLYTTEQVSHWRKPSFLHGMNVIGVRYSGPATVYLPHDIDPQMLISVKDEAGSGNITILIE